MNHCGPIFAACKNWSKKIEFFSLNGREELRLPFFFSATILKHRRGGGGEGGGAGGGGGEVPSFISLFQSLNQGSIAEFHAGVSNLKFRSFNSKKLRFNSWMLNCFQLKCAKFQLKGAKFQLKCGKYHLKGTEFQLKGAKFQLKGSEISTQVCKISTQRLVVSTLKGAHGFLTQGVWIVSLEKQRFFYPENNICKKLTLS